MKEKKINRWNVPMVGQILNQGILTPELEVKGPRHNHLRLLY